MDIYKKVFLVNQWLVFFVMLLDMWVLERKIYNTKYGYYFMAVWAIVTITSIPAYLIYLIVTW